MIDVSIIIPSYNRRESVCALVNALLDQDDSDLATEIIVVLDGSTDGSAEALSAMIAGREARVCIWQQANRGRAGARNAGLERATGSIILFLDDDVLPGPELVRAHWRAHQSADAVLGRIEPVTVPGTPRAIAEQEETFHRERHGALMAPDATIRATDVFAGNLSVKRHLLDAVGPFDEAFTGYGCEDWDMGQRLLDCGAVFAYAPDALVYHRSPLTRQQWLRHAWQEGRSQLILMRKYPSLASSLDISGLHEATWTGRLAAQFAIQFPRLALRTSAMALWLASVERPVAPADTLRRVALQSWRVAFWSGVRHAIGTGSETRAACRFCARILCYHRICDEPNPALAEWSVRPSAFRRQMQWLYHHGYQPITLSALLDAFSRGEPLNKTVVITFDDGYLDTFTIAAPILAEFGFPATVFVVPSLVGQTAHWDAEFGGEMAPLATWEHLRALEDQGWEIGLHSHTHSDLTAMTLDDLLQDLTEGRRILEDALEREVTSFAYPYGEYSADIAKVVADAGFRVAVSLGSRLATPGAPRFALERVPVMRNTSMMSFRLMVETGLDLRGLLGFGFGMPIRVMREFRRPAPSG